MSLGENIRRYRDKNNMTQEKLADKLEVSFQTVSSWERDEYRPDIDNLIKLAEVMDVSVSSLVEETSYEEVKHFTGKCLKKKKA